jgi:Lipase maturation factor
MKALGHALACLFGLLAREGRALPIRLARLYRALLTRNVSDAFTFVPRLRLREHGPVETAASEGADALLELNPHARFERWLGLGQSHQLTRFWLLRLLGFVYSAAFGSLLFQLLPLLGQAGLTPARSYVADMLAGTGGKWPAFLAAPSLFWFLTPSDGALLACAWLGFLLSLALLMGVTNAAVMLVLWVLYRSFVAIGQVWYGYGWELLLLETGFLAVLLCPLRDVFPFASRSTPLAPVWLMRWLACRLMLGAGLIKLRGDACWRDLSCLDFHFETQPLPNPVSPLLHFMPHGVHVAGVLFNHLCELVLPLFVFAPRKLRALAALLMISFQGVLIVSGNLSFLNWLTIVPLIACFDDAQLARITPRWFRERAKRSEPASALQRRVAYGVTALIVLLSIAPVLNMASSRQRMNAAFEPLNLVNSYGAFGGVGRERPELVIEGTREHELGPQTRWLAYELPAKPGDPERALPIVSPLQLRLDWQIWFAAMSSAEEEPWLLHVVWKLLHADRGLRSLLARDPFGDKPPTYVRIMRYRYHFAQPGSDAVWKRELVGYYLPPLPADDILRDALIQLGYIRD